MKAAMRICGAAKFAVLMTLLQFGQCNYIRDYEDISTFYSQDARVETLYTTMGPSECKVDKVTKAYGLNVQFTRHFHSKHTLYLMGHFVNHRHRWHSVDLDTMDVKKKDGSYYSTERLLHTFANGNCGIFSITRNWGGRGNQYELRVKNEYNGHGKCYSKFETDAKRAGLLKRIKPCKNKQ